MASGFETRQGARESFASQGPTVKQIGRGTRSGESRGAQVVGGETVAGGAPNAEITAPRNMGAQLGQFFGEAVKPYVERKQQEAFFIGRQRAMAGEAIEDLSKSHKTVVGQLFGPTAMEQGAQFYAAMSKVDEFSAMVAENKEEWADLSPEETGKRIAEASMAMMGDDPYVNQIVQQQLIDKQGPLTTMLAGVRYQRAQVRHAEAVTTAWTTAGTNFQKLAEAIPDDADESNVAVLAYAEARDNFRGMLVQPEGMDDAAYRKSLKDWLVGAAQRGEFHAFNAMIDSGAFAVLDEAGQKQVNDAEARYKDRYIARAMADDIEGFALLTAQEERGELSPVDMAAAWAIKGAKLQRKLGLRDPIFTQEALSGSRTVVKRLVQIADRAQDRQDRLTEIATERAMDEADEAAELEVKAEAAMTALRGGMAKTFIDEGGSQEDLMTAAAVAFKDGDYQTLTRQFKSDAWFSTRLADRVQSNITATAGQQYTAAADNAYGMWQVMMEQHPPAAAAYFGKYHTKLNSMHEMVESGMPKGAAFMAVFQTIDPGKYSRATMTSSERRLAEPEVAKYIDSLQPNTVLRWVGMDPRTPLGDNAKYILSEAIMERLGSVSDLKAASIPTLVKQYAPVAISSAKVEVYGDNVAWRNGHNYPPMTKILGRNSLTTGVVVRTTVDEQLKAAGVADGSKGDYIISRLPNGTLYIVSGDKAIAVTPAELKATRDRLEARKPARGAVPTDRALTLGDMRGPKY